MENNSAHSGGSGRRTASTGRRHSSTRELLLRMLEARREATPTNALAAEAGLHVNTVRGHLEHLLADGFVTRESAHAEGRGRPAWLWTARPSTAAAPYAALARVLAESIARTSDDSAAAARTAGRGWGRELAQAGDAPATDPRRAVVDTMRDAGFDPHDSGGDVHLRRCPLIETAAEHPTIVCSVHLGMIEGVIAAAGGDNEVELEPFTSPGACTLRLRAAP